MIDLELEWECHSSRYRVLFSILMNIHRLKLQVDKQKGPQNHEICALTYSLIVYLNTLIQSRSRAGIPHLHGRPLLTTCHELTYALADLRRDESKAVNYTRQTTIFKINSYVMSQPVDVIVSFVRESGHYEDVTTLETRGQLQAEFFLKRSHEQSHEGCSCRPRIEVIVQQRMSSNTDISESKKEGILALSAALNSTAPAIIIVSSQADGLTTNPTAFLR